MCRTVIAGTGAYIPTEIVANADFTEQQFFTQGSSLKTGSTEIVRKFEQITGIGQRRYVDAFLNASDIGSIAAARALDDSGMSPESIDQIIVAHNFGNVAPHSNQSVMVPSVASRIKHLLGIQNPACVAYDILFGCPGWMQGMIQADAFGKAGMATHTLVIGTETLSRVIDPFDRDSMIFSDGAGAVVLSYIDVPEGGPGMLSYGAETRSVKEVDYINMDISDHPGEALGPVYLKMQGRKAYEYAISYVPGAMKACLDKSGVDIHDVKKIFIHQANQKMDEAIVDRFYQLYGVKPPEHVMPMCIQWLGNSSVATIPTLLDLVRKGEVPDQSLHPGDLLIFASVGAGMHINAVCYRY
jgi:3-oxoacyl-[acyl-carrier-protein] synthase-3